MRIGSPSASPSSCGRAAVDQEVRALAGEFGEMLAHVLLENDRHGARIELELRRDERPESRRPR
jgi:hypothetical protein